MVYKNNSILPCKTRLETITEMRLLLWADLYISKDIVFKNLFSTILQMV